MRTISASYLKATCLAILDEVSRTGEPITVTKRGRKIVRLVPEPPADGVTDLLGTVEIHGDIVSPVLPADAWEASLAGDEGNA